MRTSSLRITIITVIMITIMPALTGCSNIEAKAEQAVNNTSSSIDNTDFYVLNDPNELMSSANRDLLQKYNDYAIHHTYYSTCYYDSIVKRLMPTNPKHYPMLSISIRLTEPSNPNDDAESIINDYMTKNNLHRSIMYVIYADTGSVMRVDTHDVDNNMLTKLNDDSEVKQAALELRNHTVKTSNDDSKPLSAQINSFNESLNAFINANIKALNNSTFTAHKFNF